MIKTQNLRYRLDDILESDVLEADDIFDHDYCKLSVNDCIIYYICVMLAGKYLRIQNV